MKMNLNKQTKYFWKEYNKDKSKFELIEIPFNKENWFYVQVDASIRTVFLKYDFPIPPYVIVDKHTHYITFYIVRDKINKKNLLNWSEKSFYIYSDLNHQAKCNSSEPEDTEYWVHYEFNLI